MICFQNKKSICKFQQFSHKCAANIEKDNLTQIESWNHLCWKRPFRSLCPTTTQHCQAPHQTMSLSATSTSLLNTSRAVYSTTSPDSLCQCFINFSVNKLLLICNFKSNLRLFLPVISDLGRDRYLPRYNLLFWQFWFQSACVLCSPTTLILWQQDTSRYLQTTTILSQVLKQKHLSNTVNQDLTMQ